MQNAKYRVSTDRFFAEGLASAYNLATILSNDPDTQIGAWIFDKNHQLMTAAGNYLNVQEFLDKPEIATKFQCKLHDDEFKNTHIPHAETAAIEKLSYCPKPEDAIGMYVNYPPCDDCAAEIAQTSIRVVITHLQNAQRMSPKWQSRAEQAYEIFHKNNIKLIMYDGKIGGVAGRTREKDWLP